MRISFLKWAGDKLAKCAVIYKTKNPLGLVPPVTNISELLSLSRFIAYQLSKLKHFRTIASL